MSVTPRNGLERIEFYEAHLAPFTTNFATIGLSSAECTQLTTLTTAARAAFTAQRNAEQAKKVATEAYHNALNAMSTFGAALVKKVRAEAEQTGNLAIYTLSAIPAPATPQPKGAPGKPVDLEVELDDGSLILTWDCPNPVGTQGTFYTIFRNDTGNVAGPFKQLGTAGGKKFIDSTVPAGATALVYKIQACRTTGGGIWASFNVTFGANTGGTMVTMNADTTAPKLAA